MAQRLGPPDAGSLSAETRELLALTALHGRPPATIEMLTHQERLVGPFLTWAAALARSGRLPARDHELLALRTAHLLDSPFEWHEHAQFARSAGLSAAEIKAVERGPDAPAWVASDRTLLLAADQLVRDGRVSDEAYAALTEYYDPAELVEIPLVVGQYAMLSMLTGFFAIPVTHNE